MVKLGYLYHVLRFALRQRLNGSEAPTRPHLEPETRDRLEEELQKCSFYLEYGSGGSTLLADSMGVRGVAVESDKYYAKTVRKVLPGKGTMQVLTPNMGFTIEWGFPAFRASQKGSKYVYAPAEALKGAVPDLIMVDGR